MAATNCSPDIRVTGPWLPGVPRPRWDRYGAVGGSVLASRCRLPRGRSRCVRRFKRFNECLGLSPLRRYLEWIAMFNEARRASCTRRVSGNCRTPIRLSLSTPPRRAAPRSGDRRVAGGLGDVSAVRSDDEGGHRVHGPFSGVPAAVSRLSFGGIGGSAAAAAGNFGGAGASGF